MNNTNQNNDNLNKSRSVSLVAWALILIFSASSVYQINGSIRDLSMLKNNSSLSSLMFLMTLVSTFMALLPIIFSIGLLIRKNWGRLGIMLISFLMIAANFYSITFLKGFYPHQILRIVFYLSVFMLLKSERVKREFV